MVKKIIAAILILCMVSGVIQGGIFPYGTVYASDTGANSGDVLIDGFEADPTGWNSEHDSGSINVQFSVSTEQAAEGSRAGKFEYTVKDAAGGDWVRIQHDFAQSADVSNATEFKFDVYPTSQTVNDRNGAETNTEPLILRVYNKNGVILAEGNIQKLTANQWNTVTYNASNWDSIGSIQFWCTPLCGQFGERSEAIYYIDNIRYTPENIAQVQKVTASPGAARVISGSAVQLSCGTPEAEIYYTTDGSNPVDSATRQKYITPIVITSDTTIKAYAAKNQFTDSEVSTFTYTLSTESSSGEYLIDSFETDPAGWNSEHDSGSINAQFTVSTEQADEGSRAGKYMYTVKDAAGYDWVRIQRDYSQPIDVSNATEFSFDVYPTTQTANDRNGAETNTEPLILRVYDRNGGILAEGNIQKLTANQWNTVTYNATNWDSIGSIQFWCTPLCGQFGERSQAVYYIDNIRSVYLTDPVKSSVFPGQVTSGTQVTLKTDAVDAKIFYTTDGSDPVASSTKQEYTGPITLDKDTVIKTFASKQGYKNSAVMEYSYTIAEQPANSELVIDGFEDASSIWKTSSAPSIGTSFNVSGEQKSEGAKSGKITFNINDFQGADWVECRRDFAVPVDLSTASKIKIDLFPTTETESHPIEPLVIQIWGDGGQCLVDVTIGKLEPQKWNTITFSLAGRSKLEMIRFLGIGKFDSYESRSSVTYYVDNIRLTAKGADAPLSTWLSPTPQVSEFNKHKVGFDFNDIWHKASNIEPSFMGTEVIKNVIDYITKNLYPARNFEFSFGGVPSREDVAEGDLWITSRKEIFEYAKALGINGWMEGHNLPKPTDFLKQNGMVPIDGLGRTPDQIPGFDMAHAYDMTNPDVIKLIKSKAELSVKDIASAGYSIVDYVWPSAGGWGWGYSNAAKTRWKEVLGEKDTGLPVKTSSGDKIVHFWDYFKDYNGFSFVPADLGYSSWDEYEPVVQDQLTTPEKKRNFYVLNMLYHYQWLYLASEVGATAKENGGNVFGIFNPENFRNGTDMTYWAKSANTGMGIFEEWAAADVILDNYSNAQYYKKQFTAANKPMALISETAAAGGNPWANPPKAHYWDNKANYLINYTLQGIWNFDSHEEEYWGGKLEDMTDPSQLWYSSYTGMKASLDGTLLAANDELKRPDTDVLSITLRSVTGHEDTSFDRGGDDQYCNLAKALTAKNYLYDQAAFPMDNIDIHSYKTILYSPRETPKGYFDTMRQWLNTPGHTLITHSFVPKREIDGVSVYDTDMTSIYANVKGDDILGLGTVTKTDVTAGSINSIDPDFAPYLNVQAGEQVQLKKPLYEITNGRPLVKLGDKNLVTEVNVGGSRVIYLNFVPAQTTIQNDSLDMKIMDAVMRYVGKTPYSEDPANQFGVLKFEKPGGYVFSIINKKAIADATENSQPFTAENNTVSGSVNLLLKPDKTYTLRDVLTGQVIQQTSGSDGKLQVEMTGYGLKVVQIYLNSISGKVIDGSKNPISGASVQIAGNGGTYSAITDTLGNYTVEDLTAGGEYSVSATKAGLTAAGGASKVLMDSYNKTVNISMTVATSDNGIPSSVITAGDTVKDQVVNGNSIKANPQLKDGNTAEVKFTNETLKEAVNGAVAGENGRKHITLEITPVKDAKRYIQYLPAEMLTDKSSKLDISIKTEHASVVLPGNMADRDNIASGSVGISMEMRDKNSLSEETAKIVGDRPIIDIGLSVDGKAVSWNNPEAPVTISFDYKPSASELKDPEHITVYYVDGSGNLVPVPNARYDSASGKIVFKTTHFSIYAAAYVKKTFKDATKYSWARKPIEVLASKGIIDTEEEYFNPQKNITRGEFIAYLVRALGLTAKVDTNFADVKTSDKYYQEIGIAKALGITNGSGNNKFSPEKEITRQDMMVLAEKAIKLVTSIKAGRTEDLKKNYKDFSAISAYAAQSIADMVNEGIIVGSNGEINPKASANKASAAAMIYNIFNKYNR